MRSLDTPDLDTPAIVRRDPARARQISQRTREMNKHVREVHNVARKTEWQRQHAGYGALGTALFVLAVVFVVALCAGTALTLTGALAR